MAMDMNRVLEFLKKSYGWVRPDGLLHICVCAIIMAFLGWIRPLWIPALITLAIGFGKEVYDKVTDTGLAEWHDIICDAIGIFVGFLITIILGGF